MIKIIKVTGSSLSPSFLPGDYVLIRRSPRLLRNLSPGDVVVFHHDVYGSLIKKVRSNIQSNQVVYTEGTHAESISTEEIGPVNYRHITGKVIKKFSSIS